MRQAKYNLGRLFPGAEDRQDAALYPARLVFASRLAPTWQEQISFSASDHKSSYDRYRCLCPSRRSTTAWGWNRLGLRTWNRPYRSRRKVFHSPSQRLPKEIVVDSAST